MNITELIARLEALKNFSKDIHYTVSHRAAYAEHLLADLVQDDISDFIDDIKENIIMGQRKLPESSKTYLEEAIKYIPNIKEGKDRDNFISLGNLIDTIRNGLKDMDAPTRGTASLYDAIGEKLDKMAGLLYMQTRLSDGLNEEVEHDHKAATETPVDRKEFKQIEYDPSKEQKIGLDYSNQAAAMCENKLDELSNKLEKLGL